MPRAQPSFLSDRALGAIAEPFQKSPDQKLFAAALEADPVVAFRGWNTGRERLDQPIDPATNLNAIEMLNVVDAGDAGSARMTSQWQTAVR
jgi:hypothetical protein